MSSFLAFTGLRIPPGCGIGDRFLADTKRAMLIHFFWMLPALVCLIQFLTSVKECSAVGISDGVVKFPCCVFGFFITGGSSQPADVVPKLRGYAV